MKRNNRIVISQRKFALNTNAKRVALLAISGAHLVNKLLRHKRAVYARPTPCPPAIRHSRLAFVKRTAGACWVAQQNRRCRVARHRTSSSLKNLLRHAAGLVHNKQHIRRVNPGQRFRRFSAGRSGRNKSLRWSRCQLNPVRLNRKQNLQLIRQFINPAL